MTTIFTATSNRPYLADVLKTHRLYRRIFGDLPFIVDAVLAGDHERTRTVGRIFETYTGQFGHRMQAADELLWPVLALRAPGSADFTRRVRDRRVAVLEQMHHAREPLARWQAVADTGTRGEVSAAFAAVDAALSDSLDDEVANLVPLIEQHLSPTEWRRLCRATRASASQRGFVIQMGWVMDGLDTGDRAEFLRSLTPSQRASWRMGGRRAWERQRDRLYDL
ncbi:hypothetical protein [Jatrophihabitans fulvus]